MKNIAVLLLIGMILIIAVWQYVVIKNDRNAAADNYKARESKYIDTLTEYRQFRKWSDSALNNATATAIQAGETVKQTQLLLNGEKGKVKELLAALDAAANEKPDSSWVTVSPNYKNGCDSLRKVSQGFMSIETEYQQDNQAYVDALAYETYIRDSALQKEREFNASFRDQLADCLVTLKNQDRATLGKTQLYAGMAAWGNSINPLGGGEINLGLKTKTDQFYEIKGAYLGKWWVGIGTKFKLSFKK